MLSLRPTTQDDFRSRPGFRPVAVRPVATEAASDPMAVYRLPGDS